MGTSRTDRAVVESANRVDDLLKSFPMLWLDEIIKIRIGPTFERGSCYQNELLKCMVCFVKGFFTCGKKYVYNLEALPQHYI